VALPQAAAVPAERAARLHRRRGARRPQAEPPPETGRAAAAEPRARQLPRIQVAVVMSPGSTAGPPVGARCWRSVPWSPKSFGGLQAATIGRRDTVDSRTKTAGRPAGMCLRLPCRAGVDRYSARLLDNPSVLIRPKVIPQAMCRRLASEPCQEPLSFIAHRVLALLVFASVTLAVC